MIQTANLAVVAARDLQLWAEDAQSERPGRPGHARAIRQENLLSASGTHG